jgi:hypothetical protein
MTRPNRAADAAAGDDARPDDEPHPDDIQPEAEAPDPDDLVKVEYEGRTYAVPQALKGALMRQADYTRKTQGLAQHRQALMADHQALAQAAAAHGANLREHGRAALLGDHVAALSRLNWEALQRQNPAQAQALLHQLFQLRQAHEIAAGRLEHQEAVAAFDRQRTRAKQVDQGHAALHLHIDGWSPQLAAKLAQYAIGQGISPEDLDELSDPRLVKVLHHACLHHEGEQKKSAGQRLAKAQAVRPAIEVGGSGSGPTDPNRMSTADWMKHRRGQLRSKAHNR